MTALKQHGFFVALCVGMTASASNAAIQNLEVSQTINEIVGTTAVVSGSGSTSNTDVWNTGDSARFILSGDDGTPAQTPVSYGLEIRPFATSGALIAGTDSLMIARTVDSQGLTDDGLISIYFSPTQNGAYDAKLRFTLYDTSFTTQQPIDFFVTSLDIDFDQIMSASKFAVDGYGLNTPTDITVTEANNTLSFQGAGNADFSDPEAAVLLEYRDTSTFDLTFSHDSVALYMLEFRNPPETVDIIDFNTTPTPVPLPAGMVLMASGLLLMRRFR